MKRIVLSLSILLLAATESHALRTGSANTLTVQNGAATVGCANAGGTSTALLYDNDGTNSGAASCIALPTCNTGEYLRFASGAFACATPATTGAAVYPIIATQSQTPIASGGTAGTIFMGLGGAMRNTNISLQQVTGSPTFKNLRCSTNTTLGTGQSVDVELVYITSFAQGTNGTGYSSFSPQLLVSLTNTNNTNGVADSDVTTTTLPTPAWIGYRLAYSANFPEASGSCGGALQPACEAEVYCTVERAS